MKSLKNYKRIVSLVLSISIASSVLTPAFAQAGVLERIKAFKKNLSEKCTKENGKKVLILATPIITILVGVSYLALRSKNTSPINLESVIPVNLTSALPTMENISPAIASVMPSVVSAAPIVSGLFARALPAIGGFCRLSSKSMGKFFGSSAVKNVLNGTLIGFGVTTGAALSVLVCWKMFFKKIIDGYVNSFTGAINEQRVGLVGDIAKVRDESLEKAKAFVSEVRDESLEKANTLIDENLVKVAGAMNEQRALLVVDIAKVRDDSLAKAKTFVSEVRDESLENAKTFVSEVRDESLEKANTLIDENLVKVTETINEQKAGLVGDIAKVRDDSLAKAKTFVSEVRDESLEKAKILVDDQRTKLAKELDKSLNKTNTFVSKLRDETLDKTDKFLEKNIGDVNKALNKQREGLSNELGQLRNKSLDEFEKKTNGLINKATAEIGMVVGNAKQKVGSVLSDSPGDLLYGILSSPKKAWDKAFSKEEDVKKVAKKEVIDRD